MIKTNLPDDLAMAVEAVLDRSEVVPNSISYNIKQAAKATGLSEKAIQNAISCRELPAKKLRGKWVITRAALMRWTG